MDGRGRFHFEPLAAFILARIREAERIFADETTLPTLDPGAGETKTAWLWAYARALLRRCPLCRVWTSLLRPRALRVQILRADGRVRRWSKRIVTVVEGPPLASGRFALLLKKLLRRRPRSLAVTLATWSKRRTAARVPVCRSRASPGKTRT